MPFAIYGETLGYVHLVSANTYQEAIRLFVVDVESVGCKMSNVFNVYAAQGRDERVDLENEIIKMTEVNW